MPSTLWARATLCRRIAVQVLQYRVLNELLNEASLRHVVRFANACGAIATQTPGAIPALPTQAQVEAFCKASRKLPENLALRVLVDLISC
jgi:hypothetical protein